MTNPLFEQAIRDLQQSHPHLSLGAAINLADHPEIPTPPYVASHTEKEQVWLLAIWASKVPHIVEYTKQGKNIHAIKEIRQYTGTSLIVAKKTWEALKQMPVCLP